MSINSEWGVRIVHGESSVQVPVMQYAHLNESRKSDNLPFHVKYQLLLATVTVKLKTTMNLLPHEGRNWGA